MRLRIFSACLSAFALAGCGAGAPHELSGLWSAGPGACQAGVGIRFDNDAITAIYPERREVLFEHPHYRMLARGRDFRVRIDYPLPLRPGGASAIGSEGVLVLERGRDGALRPASHNLLDPRTGSARLRIANDPAVEALTLRSCRPGNALRGRARA